MKQNKQNPRTITKGKELEAKAQFEARIDFKELHTPIDTVKKARLFIESLIKNEVMFHLDDSPINITWVKGDPPEALMTLRHHELWEVGSPWEYAEDIIDKFLDSL
jgi:hypothetical protein